VLTYSEPLAVGQGELALESINLFVEKIKFKSRRLTLHSPLKIFSASIPYYFSIYLVMASVSFAQSGIGLLLHIKILFLIILTLVCGFLLY